jgi:hypothetical protein
MYINSLELSYARTFVGSTLQFIHPDRDFRSVRENARITNDRLPRPRLPNVNLLLGENGSGKSTILKAIALTTLGPAVEESSLRDRGLVRRVASGKDEITNALIIAQLFLHEEEDAPGDRAQSLVSVERKGELEFSEFFFESAGDAPNTWNSVFESSNDAFFIVGYGATRRVELPQNLDMGARTKSSFSRAQRVQSLFQDSFSLVPLGSWLPRLKKEHRGRFNQVGELLNILLKPGSYFFTGEMDPGGDYLFSHSGVNIPFQGLSDGYRAFIGWVADMLFHLCHATPHRKDLVDVHGIVMVDEIDLLLHPRWQMKVIPVIARALPHVQFILTSHSPLVASSLEWMNILTLRNAGKSNATRVHQLKESIHGLDADQVLLSNFFGLRTTRAESKTRQLDELTLKASLGDDRAAELLITKMAKGMEDSE